MKNQRIISLLWALAVVAVFYATDNVAGHMQALCVFVPEAGAQMVPWYAGFVVLTTLYVALIAVMPHALGDVDNPHCAWSFYGVTALAIGLHLTAALTPPAMSVDPLSYFCHGVLGQIEPGGAYLHRVSTLDQSQYSNALRALGWLPSHGISPYGPLWTHLEAWTVGKVHGVNQACIAFQLIAMLSSTVTAFCVYKIVEVLHPSSKKIAVLFFLLNPITLFELSGEGHNDATMLMFIMAALAFTVRKRWGIASLMLAAGAGVKYVPVIFAIPQWLYFRVALGVSPRAWLGRGIIAASLCALFLVVCFCGLWLGPTDTFAGIADVSTPVTLSSIFNQIWWTLRDAGYDTPPVVTALSWSMRVAFFAFAGQLWWRADKSAQHVAAAFFGTAFFYAVVASPTFWIWYLATPCALLVALGQRHAFYTALIIGWAARFASPLDDMIRGDAITIGHATLLTTVVAAFVPLLYVLIAKPHVERAALPEGLNVL